MENHLSDKGFFYCYDRGMVKHLRYDKGIEFNCSGLNTKSKDQFWQFTRSEYLFESVEEYVKARKTDTPLNRH